MYKMITRYQISMYICYKLLIQLSNHFTICIITNIFKLYIAHFGLFRLNKKLLLNVIAYFAILRLNFDFNNIKLNARTKFFLLHCTGFVAWALCAWCKILIVPPYIFPNQITLFLIFVSYIFYTFYLLLMTGW